MREQSIHSHSTISFWACVAHNNLKDVELHHLGSLWSSSIRICTVYPLTSWLVSRSLIWLVLRRKGQLAQKQRIQVVRSGQTRRILRAKQQNTISPKLAESPAGVIIMSTSETCWAVLLLSRNMSFSSGQKLTIKLIPRVARCLQAWLEEQVHFKSTKGFWRQWLGLPRMIGTELIPGNREWTSSASLQVLCLMAMPLKSPAHVPSSPTYKPTQTTLYSKSTTFSSPLALEQAKWLQVVLP